MTLLFFVLSIVQHYVPFLIKLFMEKGNDFFKI